MRALHVEAACASGTIAFHLAFDHIRAGLADVVLVVGTEKIYSDDPARKFAVFRQPLDIAEAGRYLEITAGRLAPIPEGMQTPSVNAMMDAYAAMARAAHGDLRHDRPPDRRRRRQESRPLRPQPAVPVPQGHERGRGAGRAPRSPGR